MLICLIEQWVILTRKQNEMCWSLMTVMDRSYQQRECVEYWSLAMFLNVRLTQGRTDISLLLQPLSFSLCWLIPQTLSISPYNTLYSVFIHHLFVSFFPQNFHHSINLPNLSALPNVFKYLAFIAKPPFSSSFLNKFQASRTNEVCCIVLYVIWLSGSCQMCGNTMGG